MSFETEEQQIEKLKEWWKENGTPLVIGAALGLAGFLGWKYWEQQTIAYQQAASDLYIKVVEILETDKKEGLLESAQAVKSQYPKSSYAVLSAFQLTKLAIDKKSFDEAKSQLRWIIDKHADNPLAIIAKIRLARILIEQKEFDLALPLVEVESESGYHTLANIVKGNALYAMGRNEEALAAFKIASEDKGVASRNPVLQMRIDELSAMNVSSSKVLEASELTVAGEIQPAAGADTAEIKASNMMRNDPKPKTQEKIGDTR